MRLRSGLVLKNETTMQSGMCFHYSVTKLLEDIYGQDSHTSLVSSHIVHMLKLLIRIN